MSVHAIRVALYYTKQKILREVGNSYEPDKWNEYCLSEYSQLDQLESIVDKKEDEHAWEQQWKFLQSLLGISSASQLSRWETTCLEYLDIQQINYNTPERGVERGDEQLLRFIQTSIRDRVIQKRLLEFMRFGTCIKNKHNESLTEICVPKIYYDCSGKPISESRSLSA